MDAVRNALAEAKAFGFLGPGPVDAHIDAAQAFVLALVGFTGRGLDLGSGAGVPGLVLATSLPSSSWVLLDASSRRTSALTAAVVTLGLSGRVTVIRARAEALAHERDHRQQYEAVTARSFGPPAETAECAVGFLSPAGRLLVSEPPDSAEARTRWRGAGAAGLTPEGQVDAGMARVAVLRLTGAVPLAIPRPIQQVRRRPLF